MKRVELFNELLKDKKNSKYLEIGTDNPNSTFLNIKADKIIGVDPYSDDSNKCHDWNVRNRERYISLIEESEATLHRKTSDEFFEGLSKKTKFDLIFIDGLHTEEQVRKDVENALCHLKKGGYIFLDDALPNNEKEAVPVPKPGQGWRGTVYKFIANERINPESKLHIMCHAGMNLCVIQDKEPEAEPFKREEFPEPIISYEFYYTFKNELMNVLPHDKFIKELGL